MSDRSHPRQAPSSNRSSQFGRRPEGKAQKPTSNYDCEYLRDRPQDRRKPDDKAHHRSQPQPLRPGERLHHSPSFNRQIDLAFRQNFPDPVITPVRTDSWGSNSQANSDPEVPELEFRFGHNKNLVRFPLRGLVADFRYEPSSVRFVLDGNGHAVLVFRIYYGWPFARPFDGWTGIEYTDFETSSLNHWVGDEHKDIQLAWIADAWRLREALKRQGGDNVAHWTEVRTIMDTRLVNVSELEGSVSDSELSKISLTSDALRAVDARFGYLPPGVLPEVAAGPHTSVKTPDPRVDPAGDDGDNQAGRAPPASSRQSGSRPPSPKSSSEQQSPATGPSQPQARRDASEPTGRQLRSGTCFGDFRRQRHEAHRPTSHPAEPRHQGSSGLDSSISRSSTEPYQERGLITKVLETQRAGPSQADTRDTRNIQPIYAMVPTQESRSQLPERPAADRVRSKEDLQALPEYRPRDGRAGGGAREERPRGLDQKQKKQQSKLKSPSLNIFRRKKPDEGAGPSTGRSGGRVKE